MKTIFNFFQFWGHAVSIRSTRSRPFHPLGVGLPARLLVFHRVQHGLQRFDHFGDGDGDDDDRNDHVDVDDHVDDHIDDDDDH